MEVFFSSRFLLQLATELDAAIVSNDNYRDLINENPAFKKIIENQFEWIFKPTPLEHDFGIDACIDIVTEQRRVTGKYIGIQVV